MSKRLSSHAAKRSRTSSDTPKKKVGERERERERERALRVPNNIYT